MATPTVTNTTKGSNKESKGSNKESMNNESNDYQKELKNTESKDTKTKVKRAEATTEKKKKAEKMVLLIDKSGAVSEITIKDTQQGINELYKKAGFKTSEGFNEQFGWELQYEDTKYLVSLYAKKSGRAQNKNTYSFPPPFEEASFYGNCVLVCSDSDLNSKLWDSLFELIYEKYDENDEDDDEEEDEDEEDVEEDEEEEEEEEDIEEEEEEVKQAKGRKKKTSQSNLKIGKYDDGVICFTEVDENFLDCSSELELEKYIL